MSATRRFRIGFALAAIPACFLPLVYVSCIGWFFAGLLHGLMTGQATPPGEPSGNLVFLGWAGIYATLIQWPIYLLWAAISGELNFRKRILWMALLVLMNMFAIPWFLYCKYHGTTGSALTKGIRLKSVRRFFEKESGDAVA